MPTYLWSAKDPEGRETGQRVQAVSPEAARAILEAQGFTDLKLQKDDFANAIDAGMKLESPELEEAEFTADEELDFHRPRGFWGQVWGSLKAWSWALVPLAVWNGCNVWRGLRWGVSDVLAGVLLLAVFYLMVTLGAVSICYNRLLHEVNAARWGTVSGLLKLLRFLRWFNGSGVPEHEMVFREAQVLFEREGLGAAVRHYQKMEGHPSVPPMLYWSRVASFQFCADQIEEGLETHRRCFESGQRSTSELIDRAYHLVHHGHDPRAAGELLAQIEGREIVELARSYVSFCRGMIAYREGRHAEARTTLETAIDEALAFRHGTPLMIGHVRLIKSYLCLACARAGEMQRSQKLFREIAQFLKNHHENRLLAECRAAVGAA
jgi:hypothetical protein